MAQPQLPYRKHNKASVVLVQYNLVLSLEQISLKTTCFLLLLLNTWLISVFAYPPLQLLLLRHTLQDATKSWHWSQPRSQQPPDLINSKQWSRRISIKSWRRPNASVSQRQQYNLRHQHRFDNNLPYSFNSFIVRFAHSCIAPPTSPVLTYTSHPSLTHTAPLHHSTHPPHSANCKNTSLLSFKILAPLHNCTQLTNKFQHNYTLLYTNTTPQTTISAIFTPQTTPCQIQTPSLQSSHKSNSPNFNMLTTSPTTGQFTHTKYKTHTHHKPFLIHNNLPKSTHFIFKCVQKHISIQEVYSFTPYPTKPQLHQHKQPIIHNTPSCRFPTSKYLAAFSHTNSDLPQNHTTSTKITHSSSTSYRANTTDVKIESPQPLAQPVLKLHNSNTSSPPQQAPMRRNPNLASPSISTPYPNTTFFHTPPHSLKIPTCLNRQNPPLPTLPNYPHFSSAHNSLNHKIQTSAPCTLTKATLQ